MAHEQPFGGAPRLGNDAPGAPNPAPTSQGEADPFMGAPAIYDFGQGEDQVDRDGGGVVVPAPFGGAVAFVEYPDAPSPHGNASGPGAGALDGNSIP